MGNSKNTPFVFPFFNNTFDHTIHRLLSLYFGVVICHCAFVASPDGPDAQFVTGRTPQQVYGAAFYAAKECIENVGQCNAGAASKRKRQSWQSTREFCLSKYLVKGRIISRFRVV
jgi:hypothetical protein